VAHVRDVLAHDARVAALDIGIRIVADDIFVTGVVATAARSASVEAVVHELLPEYTVRNQLSVIDAEAANNSEPVR
jgi:hypothetical protein